MSPHVVVVGDVVLDQDVDGRVERLSPDAPVPVVDVTSTRQSPGGAGLAAVLCAASGARVTLVAPLARDAAGAQLTEALGRHVTVLPLGHEGPTRRKVRVRTEGRSLLRLDDGGPGTPADIPVDEVAPLLADADAVLVSDYGAGVTHDRDLRTLLTEAAAHTLLVWDPHPRGGAPVPGATLVTPNLAEARRAAPGTAPDVLAGELCHRWHARAVSVTAGERGAFLAAHGADVAYVPATPSAGGDPCGAGDRFAATAAVALGGGSLLPEAVEQAVADASAWVAAGGAEAFRDRVATAGDAVPEPAAGTPPAPERPGPVVVTEEGDGIERLVARLRADGGSLVATGGCFDIVHAGHVATLQAARRLGDHLVVLVNSDASVRRLKGPGRPVVPAPDRARVLQAFDCVDAVVVFDADDPRAVLARVRPDVWAKGGDYGGTELPESAVVRRHGGRVMLLPYLGGRSTTTIIERSGLARTTRTGGTA